MKIIKGTSANVKEMRKIEEESFSIPWTETSIAYEISQAQSVCFVAIDESQRIIGHVYMRQIIDEGDIINIAVRKSHRNQGVGTHLMQKLIEDAKSQGVIKITLDVRKSNEPAINLYKKFGFSAEGIRKSYYDQPSEDGIIMVKYYK
jgi:ribosomal-protein-alanine N-acetyltransferase